MSNPNLVAAAWRDVLQNSCSKPLLKKQLNHTYEKLHRGIFYNNCAAEQTFFRIAPFCRTSLSNCLCRIATVQFLNHFLSVQYYSISQPLNCWLNFTDISTYLLRVLLLTCINSREASEKDASDIQMTYEYLEVTYQYIRVTYRWHMNDTQVYTSDIRMTYN